MIYNWQFWAHTNEEEKMSILVDLLAENKEDAVVQLKKIVPDMVDYRLCSIKYREADQ